MTAGPGATACTTVALASRRFAPLSRVFR